MPRFPNTGEWASRIEFSAYGPHGPRMQDLASRGELIPLHIGDTYLDPPESALAVSLRQSSMHRYWPVQGSPDLRRAIADRLGAKQGLDIEWENLFITPGSTGALSIAAGALFDPLDEVIVLTPSWPLIFGILTRHGVRFTEVPVGSAGVPDSDAAEFAARLREAISPQTAAIYFCNPNNPSGFIYSDEHLSAIAAACEENDLWILEDIAYTDVAFDQPHVPIATSQAVAGRCITVGTFSKMFALAGHRVGYLACPEEVSPLIAPLLTHTSYHTSTSAQEMALACLRCDPADERAIYDLYAAGAQMVAERLEARFAPAMAGAFVLVDLRELGISSDSDCHDFMGRCLDVGVSLCPGGVFGKGFEGFARLCYTAVPIDVLEEAIEKLNPVFSSY